MSGARKRLVLITYDSLAMLLALWASFSVRLGELFVPQEPTVVLIALSSMAFGIAALFFLRVYRIVLRFFDLGTISYIFFGAALASGAWVVLVYFLQPTMVDADITIFVPRSIGLIYCGFLFILLFIGRYCMALLVAGIDRGGTARGSQQIPVAIYGANPAGVSLAESLQRRSPYKVAAFVDDDQALYGRAIAACTVISPEELSKLVRENAIKEVFLAIPNATRGERLAVISTLAGLQVQIKTIPSAEEIVSGRYTMTDIRPVNVNDLLRRDPVQPLTELIQQAVFGSSILVTGAGGSIGSEICRQIVHGSPRKIVLLDHSEFALYSIEQELTEIVRDRPATGQPEIVTVVGTVLNEALVREILRKERVESVYHAAAYKHVPLLERNEIAGVENNVFGTLSVAKAALDAGLTHFVMISTDKAVRPENVMGASKRVAELVVQACAERTSTTRFGIVRFGNVLDSSGSVVQLFRRQILNGGPVTVTHPDVTRFFMSIPEATQLVLQAGAMCTGGEVFVLDMGEPVKIDDLARNMIRLSGMSVRERARPDGDIEISYVGMRPGEKLYEELFINERVVSTTHPRIRKAIEPTISFDDLERYLGRLRIAIAHRDAAIVREQLWSIINIDAGTTGETGGAELPPRSGQVGLSA